MANKETKLKFKVGIEGVDKLRGLTSSLKKLNDNSLLSTSSSKKLLVSLQKQKKSSHTNYKWHKIFI